MVTQVDRFGFCGKRRHGYLLDFINAAENRAVVFAPNVNYFFAMPPRNENQYDDMLFNQLAFSFTNGLISSLSACVYPLIPITTALFGAGQVSHWSKGLFLSFIYVLGMSFTYVALGLAASWGGNIFGAYMGSPAAIVIFVILFIVLALGFLNILPLPLPNFANSLQVKKSNSLAYPLLMGIFSGFIAAPCTAPLFGALLIDIASQSSQKTNFLPAVAQALAFSFGMGLPFLLIGGFALRLPKPGNWLGAVKYFGAAVLFAAAFHYAEDLFAPYPAESPFVYATLGAVLFFNGMYFSRPLTPPDVKETSSKQIDNKFVYTAFLFLAGFGLFLLTSPFSSSGKNLRNRQKISVAATQNNSPNNIQELVWLHDLNATKEQALKEKRPILIDFYADWCSACLNMKYEFFPSQEFHDFVKEHNLLLVQIDFTEMDTAKESLAEEYTIPGLPALVFLKANGTMFDQVLGYRSKEHMLERFSKLRW